MNSVNAKEMRNAILQAVSKRAQTKFAKLFYEFDKNPTQTNCVLVLQELSEQKDFYVDFNIALKYFLDVYEQLESEEQSFLFNEAGLFIYNATKIYDRRLDCVLQRVEDQLATLSKCQEVKQTSDKAEPADTTETIEKPVKKRKRLIESTEDPFEVQWTRRKFKKLADDKLFGPGTKIDRTKLIAKKLHTENYLHPALWKYSEIVDLENEEEVDSKRNYRLFTSYVEHRYNTLVPDINFRLYYKMKDYLDANIDGGSKDDDDELVNLNNWPPLSQDFIKRYLKMEDRALAHVAPISAYQSNCIDNQRNVSKNFSEQTDLLPHDSGISLSSSLTQNYSCDKSAENNMNAECDSNKVASFNESTAKSFTDSGLSTSAENSTDLSQTLETQDKDTSDSNLTQSRDIERSYLNESVVNEIDGNAAFNSTQLEVTAIKQTNAENVDKESICLGQTKLVNESSADESVAHQQVVAKDNNLADADIKQEVEKETVALTVQFETNNNEVANDKIEYRHQVLQSPQNDEGICFSDIDDSPLSPITIHVEKSILEGATNPTETATPETTTVVEINLNKLEEIQLPDNQVTIEFWPIKLNILEFPKEILKKLRRPKLLTDLGADMELFLKARSYKRTRQPNDPVNSRQIKMPARCGSSVSDAVSEARSPSPCGSVCLGFDEVDLKAVMRGNFSDAEQTESMANKAMIALKIGEHHRLSRDSGVGNDLTASSDKNISFFPTIFEQGDEIDSVGDDLVRSNLVNNRIEILENQLLQAGVENQKTSLDKDTKSDEIQKSFSTLDKEESPTESTLEPFACEQNNVINQIDAMDDGNDDYANTKDNHLELCDDTVAKIQTWHRGLRPMLAQSRERHHFDVFQIGTNIINKFNNPNESVTFQDVMQQQDPSYVSRFFLSTLLLANQGNLALKVNNKCDDKPSDWADVNLKLLSKTRHVVAVEDNIGMITTKEPMPTTTKSKTLTTSTPRTPIKSKDSMSSTFLPPSLTAHSLTSTSRKRKTNVVAVSAATASSSFAAATTTDDTKVILNGIKTIKPIGKRPRLSEEDSGIASIDADLLDSFST